MASHKTVHEDMGALHELLGAQDRSIMCFAGSLTENVSAIVSGKASPHGKLEYILGGISAFCLILTTIWATVIIRSGLSTSAGGYPHIAFAPPPAACNLAVTSPNSEGARSGFRNHHVLLLQACLEEGG